MAKYLIITFGCQMNKSDSERMRAVFEQLNYSEAQSIDEADVVVINACSVRQPAIDRIWGLVKNYNRIKETRQLRTILTGCLLDSDRDKFQEIFDFVFNIKRLDQLQKFLEPESDILDTDYFNVRPKSKNSFQAFVPIMTGCNNFCSYCVVPHVRDREISRDVSSVIEEVKELIDGGCLEIHLLGQNVNSYNPKDKEVFSKDNPFSHYFAKLLWELNQLDGLSRIHFTSAHPKDMTEDVIRALTLPKQVNYLHLALQSGDNTVLKAMNRKYTIEEFENIVNKIREVKPDIALGTDFIVGFAGETEAQFENTIKFYEKIRFDISYPAVYSERKGTAAANMEDDVPLEDKRRRWHKLQSVMERITLEDNQRFQNKEVEVLIDTEGDGWTEGNSREMKRVRIMNDKYKIGDLVKVTVDDPQMWLLISK